jgi:hypothetical protein
VCYTAIQIEDNQQPPKKTEDKMLKTYLDMTTKEKKEVCKELRKQGIKYRTRKDGIVVCLHDDCISPYRIYEQVVYGA